MKIKSFSFIVLILLLLSGNSVRSQKSQEEFKPVFVTITTLHGVEDVDLEEWKAVEQEYFNKVTSKLDLIISHEILIQYFSRNLREVKVINVLRNWEDIYRVNGLREKLITKAWPDENERNVFFEKQNSFYSNFHSDEIYVSTKYEKKLPESSKNIDPLVFHVKTNYLSDNDDKRSSEAYKNYVEKVIQKNSLVKAYYPYRHFWGADSREFIEVFVVNSLTDLENSLVKSKELMNEFIPNNDKKKEFLKIFDLAIKESSSDIYINIPSLSK